MTLPITAAYSERSKLAYKLHQEGQTFRAIGETLGCTHTRAYVLYKQWARNLKRQNQNYAAFGAAANVWPNQVTNALLNSGVVNIDHLQQIIIHHQLAYTTSNIWTTYSRQFAFKKVGHKSWTQHILPHLASIGFDYTPYVHAVELSRRKKPKPVDAD